MDYGIFPEQIKRYSTLATLDVTLRDFWKKKQLEDRRKNKGSASHLDASNGAALLFDLETLITAFTEVDWLTESGASIAIEKVIIDTNWHRSTQTLLILRKRTPWKTLIMSSKG